MNGDDCQGAETDESKLFFAVLAAMFAPVPEKWRLTKMLCSIFAAVSYYIWKKFVTPKYTRTVDLRDIFGKEMRTLATVMATEHIRRSTFYGVEVQYTPLTFYGELFIFRSNSRKKLAAALQKCEIRGLDGTLPSVGDFIIVNYSVGRETRKCQLQRSLYSEDKLILKRGILENVFAAVDNAFAEMEGARVAFGCNSLHLMFHGPCRVGKTSIAYAIAAKYNLKITCLNASAFTATRCEAAVNLPEKNDLFIIDEFDVFLDALREDEKQSSTAMLLFQQMAENSFKSQRCMLIYTTNNIEKIEKRFLERCAVIQEVGYFDREQAKRFLATQGLPDSDYFY
jgi:hypothetical protein